MIRFPDTHTQIIYEYIAKNCDNLILYKDLISKYHMSYTTVRKKVNWLIQNNYIRKHGRTFHIIPQFN